MHSDSGAGKEESNKDSGDESDVSEGVERHARRAALDDDSDYSSSGQESDQEGSEDSDNHPIRAGKGGGSWKPRGHAEVRARSMGGKVGLGGHRLQAVV